MLSLVIVMLLLPSTASPATRDLHSQSVTNHSEALVDGNNPALFSVAQSKQDDQQKPRPKPKAAKECVDWKKEVRYSTGFDHIVRLTNNCSKSVICKISTNINPQVHRRSLEPKQKAQVMTYRGSPSRVFTAYVDCEFGSGGS
ncbi:MAG: hypothetical protein MK135_14435 [Polyangiaceae bacterium]|nr:hypothetical protein [Polyangiaceae bacterium]